MRKDLYLVLHVTREATPEEIRSAYRRRALELHPDVAGGDSESFLKLQEAYSVLSDRNQRAAYDRNRGFNPVHRRSRTRPAPRHAEPFRQVEPASGFREVSLTDSFGTFEPSFDELFDRLWSNFELVTRPKAEQLESLSVEVPLSAVEARTGGTVTILVPARLTCPACQGHGAVGWYECWQCRGQGAIAGQYPLGIPYPAGLRQNYVVRVPLYRFGIRNFYLTVRFRVTEAV